MYRLLILLLLLLLLLPLPLLAQDDSPPEALDYPSRWGIVTFLHQRHAERTRSCLDCHHQGVEIGACGICHGVTPRLPQRKDVLHKQCTSCHWQRGGPTECAGCHDPERLDESVFDD